ncbi:MAG TPA: DUF2235 domain-containing protein [Archangium sp.]|uniref:DUF2235 domain-containing protein n=1 Tax=Archangium sp. TaxID=1872627 RepID=UPI002E337355|nr:DUF2235 domain-containing protein [Archangium sp.]HEX5747499.1 DUF2235 domain-containing protein [Archangium sp.]
MHASGHAIITQASLNQAQAQSFRADQSPPAQSCPRTLVLGAFFDGSGNNMYRDYTGALGAGSETNVARLFRAYQDHDDAEKIREKIYVVGVGAMDAEAGSDLVAEMGSKKEKRIAQRLMAEEFARQIPFAGDVGGLASGLGGRERLIIAYRWARSWCTATCADTKKIIDIYGFSRGAAMARTFVKLINMGLRREIPNLSVRFLGIFDTVGSFGIPGDDVDVGQNMGITQGDVGDARHFTARHEIRQNFPLTALELGHREYAGVHSDVGGGYAAMEGKTTNHLAFVPLNDMHQASMNNGVELNTLAFPAGVSIEQIRADSEKYFPAGEIVFDPNSKYAHERTQFYERYIHTSHSMLHPAHYPEPSRQRRIFPNPPVKPFRRLPPEYEWVE